MNDLAAIRERNIQRVEIQLENSLASQLFVWKTYAGKLKAQVEALRELRLALRTQLASQKVTHQIDDGIKLRVLNTYKKSAESEREREKALAVKKNQLRDELALVLAENFAISSFRDRLVAKLSELCSAESCDLFDAQKQAVIHLADCEELAKIASAEKLQVPPLDIKG